MEGPKSSGSRSLKNADFLQSLIKGTLAGQTVNHRPRHSQLEAPVLAPKKNCHHHLDKYFGAYHHQDRHLLLRIRQQELCDP